VLTTSARPTRDGVVAATGGLALLLAGLSSGNNLLYLVAAPLWAALLLALPLGWWNVRGLQVRRVLPAELYAGREAPGSLLVRNPRRRLGATSLRVHDEDTTAAGTVERLPCGQIVTVPVRWRFGDRGPVRLSSVTVRSSWPFGFAEHVVQVPLVAEVVVYPRPLPAAGSALMGRTGMGAEEDVLGQGTGEFLGLRPYRPGDPPRTVHWPTTARVGTLQVVERSGETEVSVEVSVERCSGPAWERELSRATGEVHRALQLGRKVGLRLPAVQESPERHWPPSGGASWRRTLLEALARMPRLP
jgi:uncharacterized protein (DUF58 family)